MPVLPYSMLGPLGVCIGEGSSCLVYIADYQGREAAVKMLLRNHQPYEAALREATMYQVGDVVILWAPLYPPPPSLGRGIL